MTAKTTDKIDIEQRRQRTQQLVKQLLEANITPQEISEALEGRASVRTVYRWASGETGSQNKTVLALLEGMVDKNA